MLVVSSKHLVRLGGQLVGTGGLKRPDNKFLEQLLRKSGWWEPRQDIGRSSYPLHHQFPNPLWNAWLIARVGLSVLSLNGLSVLQPPDEVSVWIGLDFAHNLHVVKGWPPLVGWYAVSAWICCKTLYNGIGGLSYFVGWWWPVEKLSTSALALFYKSLTIPILLLLYAIKLFLSSCWPSTFTTKQHFTSDNPSRMKAHILFATSLLSLGLATPVDTSAVDSLDKRCNRAGTFCINGPCCAGLTCSVSKVCSNCNPAGSFCLNGVPCCAGSTCSISNVCRRTVLWSRKNYYFIIWRPSASIFDGTLGSSRRSSFFRSTSHQFATASAYLLRPVAVQPIKLAS